MAFANGRMVLEALLGQSDEFVLEVRNLTHAGAAEESVLDGIFRNTAFRHIEDEFAVLCLQVGNRNGHGTDASFVAAPAGTWIHALEHGVEADRSLAGHQFLRHRAAVEEDDLVFLVAIVVVPVQDGSGDFGCEGHGAHRDGGAHVDFARSYDAAVIEFGQDDARADAQIGLHLVPAAQGDGVQMIDFDIFVNDTGDLSKGVETLGRNLGEIGVLLQALGLGNHHGVVIGHGLDLLEQFAQVEALHGNAVFLEGDFIETDRLESGGTGADAAQVETLHPIDHPADGGEVTEILLEFGRRRMHHMGFQAREGYAVLAEYVGDGELAAIGIAAERRSHFADFVWIGLHQDGNTGILKGQDGAVLVCEDRHRENDAVILSFVFGQPFGIEDTLVAGLHATIVGQFLVHDNVVVAGIGHGLDHVLAGGVNQFSGHQAPVGETQCKCHFLFHFVGY